MQETTTENNLPMPIILSLPLDPNSTLPNAELFLKDPSSDMFIMMGEIILPIHGSYCLQSQLINRQWVSGHKFCFLPASVEIEVVTSILKLFYGATFTVHNYRQLDHVLIVLQLLEISSLTEMLEQQLVCLVEDCDVFSLLNIAYRYQLQQLFNCCFKTLLSEQFEQMLYNKYDFMHCQFELFQIVLRLHYRLQEKGKISGVEREEIEEIIKLYCVTNGYNKRTCMRLLGKYGTDDLKEKIRAAFLREQERNVKKMEEYLKNVENMVMTDDNFYEEMDRIEEEKENVNDFFGHESVESKVSIEIEDSPQLSPEKSPRRNRKFSEKMDGLLKPKQKNFMGDYRSQNLKERNLLNLQRSIEEEKPIYPYSAGNPIEVPHMEDDEDADELVGKISYMLDQYQNAYEKHETNFNKMKRKQTMQSAIFNEGTDTNFTSSRRYNGEGIFGRHMAKNKDQQIFPQVGRSVFDTQRIDDSPTLPNKPTL